MSNTRRPIAAPRVWRIGRFVGVDILIRPSLLVIGALLVLIFAPRFADRDSSNPYLLAAVFVIALYVSILIHELAHVAVAKGFRMQVRSVTLHLLGGETVIEGESRTPWQELSTAIVGPIASLLIGGASLWLAEQSTATVLTDILWSLGWVNVIVAGFNMLPGLPLDGGRVFRALIWQVTSNELTGVRLAAWIGRISAVAVIAVVAVFGDWGSSRIAADLAIAVLVAVFLWQGSAHALRSADRTGRINTLVARQLADPVGSPPPNAPRISADLQGTDLLRAMGAQPSEAYLLVEHDGRISGLLWSRRVNEAYQRGGR